MKKKERIEQMVESIQTTADCVFAGQANSRAEVIEKLEQIYGICNEIKEELNGSSI